MTIEPLPTPCASISCPSDEMLDGQCFPSEADAYALLWSCEPPADAGVEAHVSPCHVMVCDGCDRDLEDEDISAKLHFPDADAARRYARREGWTSSDGRRWYCEDCSEAAGVADCVVPVVAGQIELGAQA